MTQKKPVDKNGNFMAFIASVKSGGESSEYASPNLRESSQISLMVAMTCIYTKLKKITQKNL
jgi:hypothetical protein